MIKKIAFLFALVLLLIQCGFNNKDLQGLYVSQNNNNLIDSLRLLPDGKYVKTIYRKSDKGFIYKNTGPWQVKDGSLFLEDFLVDNDRAFSETHNFQDILISCVYSIEKKSGKVVIYHNQSTEDIYYEKIN